MQTLGVSEIREKMRLIHSECRTPLSNFYNNIPHVETISFDCILESHTIVFCMEDVGIYRAYYYSSDPIELGKTLSKLPAGTIIDIVDRDRVPDYPWISGTGFELYTTYIRFGRTLTSYEEVVKQMADNPVDVFYDETYGQYPTMEDIPEIRTLIDNGFDPKTDHLFSNEQLKELIEEGAVTVERDSDGIYCVFISRIFGKKYYANLIVNQGSADVSYSLEKKALLKAIKEHGVNYMYAWIDERNKKALKRAAGFPEDNLFNHIYEKKEG